MPCIHKFYQHPAHLSGENGLIPNWKIKTLIVGTFNPSNIWHESNEAKYFYGREANYLWNVLPIFAGKQSISRQEVDQQLDFLKDHEIGLTDLLLSIDDAEIGNEIHKARIKTVKDKEIELFSKFTWNTDAIINYITENKVEAVYFTYLGNKTRKKVSENTFEEQTRNIESACEINQIFHSRLHTPSGQGLGPGSPRENVLVQRWYTENTGDRFPFLDKKFDLGNYPINNKYGLTDEVLNKFF